MNRIRRNKKLEQKALAYANMYGVLGALENLCVLDSKAKEIVNGINKPVSLCFDVKEGPCRTFHFDKNGCKITEGSAGCNCKMNFSSPEKFQRAYKRLKPGVPVKGAITLLKFLTGPFTDLTNRLTEILRPSKDAMADRAFFEENTMLTMYVIAGAISALANNESIAKISAANTPDGDVQLGIKDKAAVTISVKDHHFTTLKKPCDNPRAVMEFASIDLANRAFFGHCFHNKRNVQGQHTLGGRAFYGG